MIAEISGRHVEIQVRTHLQHLWAELSEKASDVMDPAIKYGGGPETWRKILAISSEIVRSDEAYEVPHLQSEAADKEFIADWQRWSIYLSGILENSATEEESRKIRAELELAKQVIVSAEERIERNRAGFENFRSRVTEALVKLISSLGDVKDRVR
jgi:ppGpp synthetase/RelA/SpoT-type nucleotidyltranferase